MKFGSQSAQPLLADGPMGSLLLAAGFSGCLEDLVRTHPTTIAGIHSDYLKSGAKVLLTHTFGANHLALARHGLADDVALLNQRAVQVLRQAVQEYAQQNPQSGPQGIVGNIGPSQLSTEAMRHLPVPDLSAAFREQALALQAAGVDAVLLETFSQAQELAVALEVLSDLEVPLICTVSVRDDGCLWDGTRPAEWLALWQFYQPQMVGLNCVQPTSRLLVLLEQIQKNVALPIWLKCHAGLPDARLSAAQFAQALAPFLSQIVVVGACCGATPAHILALQAVLKNQNRS